MTTLKVISFLAAIGILGLLVLKKLTTGNVVASINKTQSENINESTTNKSKMKTIGILGGFGPQATMELEAQIHRAAQRLIPPLHNSGYPTVIVCL